MFTVSCGQLPQLMKIVVSAQLMQFTNGCSPFSSVPLSSTLTPLLVDSCLHGCVHRPQWCMARSPSQPIP